LFWVYLIKKNPLNKEVTRPYILPFQVKQIMANMVYLLLV